MSLSICSSTCFIPKTTQILTKFYVVDLHCKFINGFYFTSNTSIIKCQTAFIIYVSYY
jgi:hypothetical protein